MLTCHTRLEARHELSTLLHYCSSLGRQHMPTLMEQRYEV